MDETRVGSFALYDIPSEAYALVYSGMPRHACSHASTTRSSMKFSVFSKEALLSSTPGISGPTPTVHRKEYCTVGRRPDFDIQSSSRHNAATVSYIGTRMYGTSPSYPGCLAPYSLLTFLMTLHFSCIPQPGLSVR